MPILCRKLALKWSVSGNRSISNETQSQSASQPVPPQYLLFLLKAAGWSWLIRGTPTGISNNIPANQVWALSGLYIQPAAFHSTFTSNQCTLETQASKSRKNLFPLILRFGGRLGWYGRIHHQKLKILSGKSPRTNP